MLYSFYFSCLCSFKLAPDNNLTTSKLFYTAGSCVNVDKTPNRKSSRAFHLKMGGLKCAFCTCDYYKIEDKSSTHSFSYSSNQAKTTNFFWRTVPFIGAACCANCCTSAQGIPNAMNAEAWCYDDPWRTLARPPQYDCMYASEPAFDAFGMPHCAALDMVAPAEAATYALKVCGPAEVATCSYNEVSDSLYEGSSDASGADTFKRCTSRMIMTASDTRIPTTTLKDASNSENKRGSVSCTVTDTASFSRTMTCDMSLRVLNIPKAMHKSLGLCRAYKLSNGRRSTRCTIHLCSPDGARLPVTMITMLGSQHRRLTKGWRSFCDHAGLRIGDTVHFHKMGVPGELQTNITRGQRESK